MKRAAAILEYMESRPEGVTMKEITELTGLSKFGSQWTMQQLQKFGVCWPSNRGRGAVWRLGRKP